MTGPTPAERLAAASPEVTRRAGKFRVFLPAARLYGGRRGGAVTFLSRQDAESLRDQLTALLAERPATAHEGYGGRA